MEGEYAKGVSEVFVSNFLLHGIIHDPRHKESFCTGARHNLCLEGKSVAYQRRIRNTPLIHL